MYTFMGDSHSEVLGPALQKLITEVEFSWPKDNWPRGKSTQSYVDHPSRITNTTGGTLVFELGTNDGVNHLSANVLRVNLEKIVELAAGRQVVWVGPPHVVRPDVAAAVASTDAVLATICGELSIPYMDSKPFTQTGHYDGVHYHTSQYHVWAKGIADFLTALQGSFV